MDSSTQKVLKTEDEKLDYLSVNVVHNTNIDYDKQIVKTIEIGKNVNDCSYNDLHDEDEGRSKLRKRNPENWKQNVRKRNKNKGLEYIKANGELCERKKLGPPCTCKEKCYIKIGTEACEKIFQNFWKLGDHALQNAYIAGCVRIFLPKHCYKKDGLPSRRFFSRNFHVTVNGVDTEVCKQAFLNMHAISNGRLDRLLKKKQEIGNTGFDERGRHSNKVNKIPIEKIRLVRDHINGFRKRAGFTGKRKPKKVELLPGLLNIRTMYRSYREEMIMKGLEPVCEYRYRKIFHSDFHLDFGKTVASNTATNEVTSCQSLHVQTPQHQPQQSPNSNEVVQQQNEKVNKSSQRISNIKRNEIFTNSSLQNMNVNVQMISSVKGVDKTMPVYSEYSDGNVKDFHMRTSDATPYVIPHEVFRLDYTYNPQQHSWVFPNQN